jgi:hypothetical protein
MLRLPALLALVGCADAIGAGSGNVSFVIIPEFGELAPFANNADLLGIVVRRASDGSVAAADTVAIDPVTGEATAELSVVLLLGSEVFEVHLQAIRSSDGEVLFEGVQLVTVTGTSGSTPVTIPVTYAGPTGVSCVIAPADTAVAFGGSFTFRAAVYDAQGLVVAVPVTFDLVTPADSLILSVSRHTGAATANATVSGTVFVVARSADGLTDTARVAVGAIPGTIRVTPGFANLAVGSTLTLAADLLDGSGTLIGPATGATFVSRTPAVATVSSAGVVSGVAAGTSVIVVTSGSFADSMIVRVAAAGSVPVSAIAGGRAFSARRVGDTVVVDVTADMSFTAGELLGSYNAELRWNPAVLRYVDVQAGTFGAPTINDTQTGTGLFRFSAANANGLAGSVVVARVRFVADAAGSGNPQLTITELSAALSFTNLLSSVVVTSGSVTVSP